MQIIVCYIYFQNTHLIGKGEYSFGVEALC